jgi:hypothetical protein
LDCCNDHDRGYGTCNSNKEEIDSKLFSCLVKACQNAYGGLNPANLTLFSNCVTVATFFHTAVSSAGTKAYEDAQKEACDCCPETTCSCPEGFPHRCPPEIGGCCAQGFPVCCPPELGGGCCAQEFPVCCPPLFGGGCCPQGTTCCPGGGCCPQGTTCCPGGGCCPQGTRCCPSGCCPITCPIPSRCRDGSCCPPERPYCCPDNFCCGPLGRPVCCPVPLGGGCCPLDFPKCCPGNPPICCPGFAICAVDQGRARCARPATRSNTLSLPDSYTYEEGLPQSRTGQGKPLTEGSRIPQEPRSTRSRGLM